MVTVHGAGCIWKLKWNQESMVLYYTWTIIIIVTWKINPSMFKICGVEDPSRYAYATFSYITDINALVVSWKNASSYFSHVTE